jgi:hypothetical protein
VEARKFPYAPIAAKVWGLSGVKGQGDAEIARLAELQRGLVQFGAHGHRSSFETDRLRDQRLIAAGHRVLRITARQMDFTPYAVIARLAAAIAVVITTAPIAITTA